MKYSQNNEQQHILAACAAVGVAGRFMDIGAYDGKTFSNTLALAEFGWGGVCVEPSAAVLEKLKAVHVNRPHVVILPVAVTVNGGNVVFWDSGGDAVSTCSEDHMRRWSGEVRFNKVEVPSISVQELFKSDVDFDFINLDVEGQNFPIFELIPWERLTKLRCVCVEHEGFHVEMTRVLAPFGFRQVDLNGENVILSK